MFKCKEKSCLCSWVAYCDNHVGGATWHTECKRECQENCWRLPNCMWFGVTCWACVLANVTGGGKRHVSINQLVMTCPKTNTLDLAINKLFMLIDWNGPLQTDRMSSLKEGPKWCAVHQEYDRVHMTKTPYCSKTPGHFLGFFVSLTSKTIDLF